MQSRPQNCTYILQTTEREKEGGNTSYLCIQHPAVEKTKTEQSTVIWSLEDQKDIKVNFLRTAHVTIPFLHGLLQSVHHESTLK